MSRSYKKRPYGKSIWGNTHFSEKDFKQGYNRKIRRRVSQIMTSYHPDEIEDMILPERDIEFDDVWNSKTDGRKGYFGDLLQNKIEFYQNYHIDYNNSNHIYINRDNVEQVIKENNINQILADSIVWHVNKWGYYHHWSKVSYILRETMEEQMIRHHKLYAEMMRK